MQFIQCRMLIPSMYFADTDFRFRSERLQYIAQNIPTRKSVCFYCKSLIVFSLIYKTVALFVMK